MLLVLGIALLVQGYLIITLLRSQQRLEQRIAKLARRMGPIGNRKPPKMRNGRKIYEERGRQR